MPTSLPAYPGTQQHQALFNAIINYYRNDPRVLSIIVLGSLGRGNWDALSDLDLDVVITDDAQVDINKELRDLCASFDSINERPAIIFAEAFDEGEIVLESLMMLSIRYHPLADTNHTIVDSMKVLYGSLDHATIAAAGTANWKNSQRPLPYLLDRTVRHSAVASVYYRRGSTWGTIELLHTMRGQLMEIFARTHGGIRPYHTFESQAVPRLKARLGRTLPQGNFDSLHAAIIAMLDFLEFDLAELSDGQLTLSPGQRIILSRVRESVA